MLKSKFVILFIFLSTIMVALACKTVPASKINDNSRIKNDNSRIKNTPVDIEKNSIVGAINEMVPDLTEDLKNQLLSLPLKTLKILNNNYFGKFVKSDKNRGKSRAMQILNPETLAIIKNLSSDVIEKLCLEKNSNNNSKIGNLGDLCKCLGHDAVKNMDSQKLRALLRSDSVSEFNKQYIQKLNELTDPRRINALMDQNFHVGDNILLNEETNSLIRESLLRIDTTLLESIKDKRVSRHSAPNKEKNIYLRSLNADALDILSKEKDPEKFELLATFIALDDYNKHCKKGITPPEFLATVNKFKELPINAMKNYLALYSDVIHTSLYEPTFTNDEAEEIEKLSDGKINIIKNFSLEISNLSATDFKAINLMDESKINYIFSNLNKISTTDINNYEIFKHLPLYIDLDQNTLELTIKKRLQFLGKDMINEISKVYQNANDKTKENLDFFLKSKFIKEFSIARFKLLKEISNERIKLIFNDEKSKNPYELDEELIKYITTCDINNLKFLLALDPLMEGMTYKAIDVVIKYNSEIKNNKQLQELISGLVTTSGFRKIDKSLDEEIKDILWKYSIFHSKEKI